MKVIARLDNDNGYIVELSKAEFREIVDGDSSSFTEGKSGETFKIHERFMRIINIANNKVGSKSYDSVRYHLEQLLHNLTKVEDLVEEVKEQMKK